MGYTSMSSSTSTVVTSPREILKERSYLYRTNSSNDLCNQARIQRSYSDNQLCYSVNRIRASSTQPKLKSSRSMGGFKFHLQGSIVPKSIRSFLFEPETSKEIKMVEDPNELDEDTEMDMQKEKEKEKEKKRANWVERLMEVRTHWREKQQKDEVDDDGLLDYDCDGDGEGCEVDYDDEEGQGKMGIDRETFSRLLTKVSWSDTKDFSQLAFLCNMAYVISEMKADDLRRYYDLELVTSSLEKKAEAAAMIDQDSTCVPLATLSTTESDSVKSKASKNIRPSVAYEIAASAASYIQSCAKDLLSLGSEQLENEGDDVALEGNDGQAIEEEENPSSPRVYKSEVAAYVAASTMTAVVAAGEKEKEEAARDLQSLHSSPCEWFICDDSRIYTRIFVIQGSDSLAAWQANLFFEPTRFEGTNVLVHRGIYEAAKGIYEQFMPQIMEHLNRYGERAKLQFTGHSLGGSLSLLVNLMLLTRKVVKPSALRPVVTFGSPFIFCGGQKILDELGLDENFVHCVIMHRDIVPRAFSCNYPNHVALLLKRLHGTFRSHPCLNENKLLYAPMGKIFILQPNETSSPPHPLLPPGSALYALENTLCGSSKYALMTFLNSPHPLETLSDPTAYGSDGSILRDHDSSNYLKAVTGVIRQNTKIFIPKERKQRSHIWPLLATQSPHAWSQERNLNANGLQTKEEIMTSV